MSANGATQTAVPQLEEPREADFGIAGRRVVADN